MNRHRKILDTLFTIANDLPRTASASIATAVAYRGQVISFGQNSYKTHPLQKKFSTNPMAVYLHAEISAIKNASRKINIEDFKRCSLYIVRSKYDPGTNEKIWGISKPCAGCMSAIMDYEFKQVYYSMEGIGNFKKMF